MVIMMNVSKYLSPLFSSYQKHCKNSLAENRIYSSWWKRRDYVVNLSLKTGGKKTASHLEHDASYKGLTTAQSPLKTHFIIYAEQEGNWRPEWAHLIPQLIMETDSIYSLHMREQREGGEEREQSAGDGRF